MDGCNLCDKLSFGRLSVIIPVAQRCVLLAGWPHILLSLGLRLVLGDDEQGDHLSGKPGNVREFETCQGNVREKILSGKSFPKLFISR